MVSTTADRAFDNEAVTGTISKRRSWAFQHPDIEVLPATVLCFLAPRNRRCPGEPADKRGITAAVIPQNAPAGDTLGGESAERGGGEYGGAC